MPTLRSALSFVAVLVIGPIALLGSGSAAAHPPPEGRVANPSVLLALAALRIAPPAPDRADPKGVWPLRPRPVVVRGFDDPGSPWGAGHRGVDLLGSPGQRVVAAQAGRISFVGIIAGRGVVAVDHGGTRTTYEPVDASVTVGEAVAAGEQIGLLQTGGSHCFPRSCLHWGLIEGADHYLDPLTLVGLGPVRLLPLLRTAFSPGHG